jgi:dTDP-4-amino-4,6-dideoxygalactose transaminase
LSFHATKVFNTFEGGAIVCHSLEMKQQIDLLKNFGIYGDQDITLCGLNGKMSEVNAAFGLLYLDYVDAFIDERKKIHAFYHAQLSDIAGIECFKLHALKHNYAYFPIVVTDDFPLSRDELHQYLLNEDIMARKYFHPLLTDLSLFKMYKKSVPNAAYIASRILCLPIYPGLSANDLSRIMNVFEHLTMCVD